MSLVLDGSACPPVRGGQADRRRYGGSAAPGAGVGLLSGQIVLPGHTDRHTDLVQHPVDPIHRRIPLRTMMLIRRPVRTLPLDPLQPRPQPRQPILNPRRDRPDLLVRTLQNRVINPDHDQLHPTFPLTPSTPTGSDPSPAAAPPPSPDAAHPNGPTDPQCCPTPPTTSPYPGSTAASDSGNSPPPDHSTRPPADPPPHAACSDHHPHQHASTAHHSPPHAT